MQGVLSLLSLNDSALITYDEEFQRAVMDAVTYPEPRTEDGAVIWEYLVDLWPAIETIRSQEERYAWAMQLLEDTPEEEWSEWEWKVWDAVEYLVGDEWPADIVDIIEHIHNNAPWIAGIRDRTIRYEWATRVLETYQHPVAPIVSAVLQRVSRPAPRPLNRTH